MTIETIIGLLAAIMTTSAFIPQAVRVIKTRHTKDISLYMYVIFVVGLILWLTYGILLINLPIIIANIFSLIFASIILYLKIKYK
ncbi:MAG TPA: SemiSWEET transporter [Candidatus Kapabacteria bacterium]|jgi:MtN3 and saliva related transmembrane protein|nr:SemiSWEET transporter [Candidatus Kapabacteria bacterium]HOM04579.1 SemiSWEET transporter [Candidatus Kapabacteria bacterium]HOQ48635.1 SemiSWEET transporter [Candidatus Kapabacteria bacterium]HPP39419.1 SemiSWEET transporter [Candidatus Kapabacteria bacterium]HPU23760.1 SemiSWEET transporter [Candidatus Kapabacteria bacterium]